MIYCQYNITISISTAYLHVKVVGFTSYALAMAAPILPAKFLENRRLKAKSKILEKLVKFWKNGCLRTLTQPILHCKDGNTLIEWS